MNDFSVKLIEILTNCDMKANLSQALLKVNARTISDPLHAAIQRIHREMPKGRQNFAMVKYMAEVHEGSNDSEPPPYVPSKSEPITVSPSLLISVVT